MDPEKKAQWVTALRSGEYQQGVGVLKYVANIDNPYSVHYGDDKSYHCCLGVLCELAKQEGVVTEWSGAPHPGSSGAERVFGHVTPAINSYSDIVLPRAVQEWARLSEPNPVIDLGSGWEDSLTLSQHNDSGATFNRIADLIEQYL